jgi:hypothetical protein
MTEQAYMPNEALLELFGRKFDSGSLCAAQQVELREMCEPREIRDAFYFTYVVRRTPLIDISYSFRQAVGVGFILRCSRVREAMRLKEESQKAQQDKPAIAV